MIARSPFFYKRFTDKKQGNSIVAATVTGISREAFADFLYFIYTGCLQDIKTHHCKLLELGHQFELIDLKSSCEAELLNALTAENAADTFQIAHQYDCERTIKKAAFRHIKE